jgi:hypothetical protein
MNSIVNDHANDTLTRSIVIDNAVQHRGFLPYIIIHKRHTYSQNGNAFDNSIL